MDILNLGSNHPPTEEVSMSVDAEEEEEQEEGEGRNNHREEEEDDEEVGEDDDEEGLEEEDDSSANKPPSLFLQSRIRQSVSNRLQLSLGFDTIQPTVSDSGLCLASPLPQLFVNQPVTLSPGDSFPILTPFLFSPLLIVFCPFLPPQSHPLQHFFPSS